MDDHVEARRAEVGLQALGGSSQREVGVLLVPLVLAHVGGHVVEGVVLGVERQDAFELELAAVGELQRRIELPATEQRLEDAERRGPGAEAHGRAGLRESLGDGKAEAGIVGHASHERALA